VSRRLGIAVSRTALRVVALERGHVVWAAERALAGPNEIAPALAELAAERPRGYSRARVVLAGELVQVKTLAGLPRLSAAQLDRAVAFQASRWFLKNGRPLVTAAARVGRGADVLAAATERDVVEAVRDGAGRAGLRLDTIGPAVGACPPLLADGDYRLSADSVCDHVTVRRGLPTAVRRLRQASEGAVEPAVPGLEGEGSRFFAAYAAARARPAPAFGLNGSDAERSATLRRTLIRLGGLGAALWLTAALIVVLRANGAIRDSRAHLAALAPALDAAVAVERDLALADGLLAEVRRAQAARSRDAQVLSVLTRALPDSTWLNSLRRGRDGRVTVVGLGPSAARIPAALAQVPGIVSPALQGGVTRDLTGGRAIERFVVTFTWRPVAEEP
jgi:hypothetical protein